jgi:hypothetical protein
MKVSRRSAIGSLAIAASASFVVAGCESDNDQSQTVPTTAPAPTTAPRTRTTGPSSTDGRRAASTTTTTPSEVPPGVTLREPDGSYPAGLPNDPKFFALGVWLETVTNEAEVALDRSFGLNLYVGLAHEDLTDLDAIEAGGMHLIMQADDWSDDRRADHPAVAGWLVYDEADLMYGPGWDHWRGIAGWNTCIPIQDQGGQCGYTVMQHFNDRVPRGALRYANYGLGVLRFESDAEAEVFINNGFQHVVSGDHYFFTHPSTATEDRKGASYGTIVKRLRHLDGLAGGTEPADRQPVWAFVELGAPFEDGGIITPPQVRSAVWHSIIAGARGVVYFNHSFGGPCPTFTVLRDTCPDTQAMRPAIAELNGQIAELAAVLNAPFADGYVTAKGPAQVMAKLGPDGAWYVFAAANTAAKMGGEVTFRVAAGSAVEVINENRRLTATARHFVDTFADGNSVHIYRVT